MSSYVTPLVGPDNPILTTELEQFDFSNPPEDPVIIAKKLAESMISYGGVGLAANQIGLVHRACAIQTNPIVVMFNPKITAMSDDYKALIEGCLSFPNLVVKVKRPTWIRLRYHQPNGEVITKRFEGMTARAICHEIDHLNGVLFYQRASRYHLDKAKKKLKSIQRKTE